MKIKILMIISFCLICLSSRANHFNSDSIIQILNYEISNRDVYVSQKEYRLKNLKELRKKYEGDLSQIYSLNSQLYNEYRKYIIDSAVVYVEENLQIAYKLKEENRINESKIQLASLYSAIGMYIESLNLLKSINSKQLSLDLLPDYYETFSGFYNHYAESTRVYHFYNESGLYSDSLLNSLSSSTMRHKILTAGKSLWSGDITSSRRLLTQLLDSKGNGDGEKAYICYLLGSGYEREENLEEQKKYFALSAIYDIRGVIKENASFQSLALTLYNMGDINEANKLIKYAMEDAETCNSRFRTFGRAFVQPAINEAYEQKIESQKNKMQTYLILISVLALSLIVAIFYVYKQMKRLGKMRKDLHLSNIQLQKLNDDLNKKNEQQKRTNIDLTEANHIKETYIINFLDSCSRYIEDIENYSTKISKLFKTKQYKELSKILETSEFIDKELESLYQNFDNVFLHIYPTFVEDFNALLEENEQFTLKQNELLNAELRIFALIRLGITDTSKIASFLRYSMSTIYNYRHKVRSKAKVPREQFEDYIMKIGSSF